MHAANWKEGGIKISMVMGIGHWALGIELAEQSAYTGSSHQRKGATSHIIGLFGYILLILLSGEFCSRQVGNVKKKILF
jgi:hypothetical protein